MRVQRIVHVIESLVKAYKLHGRPVTRVEIGKVGTVSRQTVGMAIGNKFPGIRICQQPMRIGARDTTPWTYKPSPKTIKAVGNGTFELPASKIPKPKEKGIPRGPKGFADISTLGGRLKACRINTGLTQELWGARIGYHPNTIQANECEETVPRAPFLKAYVEQGYNVNWVLTGEGERKL